MTDRASARGLIHAAVERHRRELLRLERAGASEMVRAYGAIWQRLRAEIMELSRQYNAALAANQAITPAWVFEFGRLDTLQRQTEAELRRFIESADRSVVSQERAAVDAAQAHFGELMGRVSRPGLSVAWARLPVGATEDLVGYLRNGSPLRTLLDELGPQASQAVREGLLTGLALGQGPRETARRVRAAFGGSLDRALKISRTETMRAYRGATLRTYRENSDIVTGWRWLAAKSPRTCPMCLAIDGTWHPLTEGLNDHPNGRCVAPGTLVYSASIEAFVSRHYEGYLVTVRTASGKLLSVTPNHPILTDRGWVAAELLQEGDNVVCDPRRQGATGTMTPDKDNVPSLIEDIPRALGMTLLGSMPCASEDFHGDGRNSQVYVVWANSPLRDACNLSLVQPRRKELFGGRNAQSACFSGGGDLASVGEGLFPPSGRLLRNGDSTTMFLERSLLCQELVCLGLVPKANLEQFKPAPQGASANPIFSGQDVFRFPGLVSGNDLSHRQRQLGACSFSSLGASQAIALLSGAAQPVLREDREQPSGSQSRDPIGDALGPFARQVCLDRVIEIGSRTFSGHVYNLQTTAGWYSANGIITHNCAAVPALRGDPRDDPGWETGAGWFAAQGADVQRQVLGDAGYEAYKAGAVSLDDFIGLRRSREWGTTRYARSLVQIAGEKDASCD